MEIKVIQATPEDAPFIAKAVLTAIGDDHVLQMAESKEKISLLEDLFTHLAAMGNSQYSFRNALIAVTVDGKRIGAVVSYDGARLHQLRQAFVNEGNRILGWNLSNDDLADETSPDEVYLDSLMVLPEYQGNGFGSILIDEAIQKARKVGKPLGLLVDYNNPSARKLYIRLGFKSVGSRPFAGKDMEHLQKTL
ncbi:MAG: GNAT family N-acetyltransferase [Bacteroidaceae bacterium]|nr:GNAT family N-acetyltransferase [Bacteroidaceae bacterium]